MTAYLKAASVYLSRLQVCFSAVNMASIENLANAYIKQD